MRIVFTDVSLQFSGGIAKYVRHTLAMLNVEHEVALFCPYEAKTKQFPILHLENESDVLEFAPDIIQNNGLLDFALLRRLALIAPVVEFVHIYNECADGGRYLFKKEKSCGREPGVGCWSSILSRNCVPSNRPNNWWKFWRRAENYAKWLTQCSKVLTNSEFMKGKLEFSNAVVDVVSLSLTDPLLESVCDPPDGDLKFMFVGRPVAMKGLHHFLEAAVNLKGDFEIFIKVISETPYVKELMAKYATRLKIVFQEQLDYREAHVVVVPSLFPEPFGLVGWEAFNCSRPVVAYNTGGVSEWHLGEDVGCLVKPGDRDGLTSAMQRYLDCFEDVKKHGEAAFEHVQKNGPPEAHAAKLIEKYQKILKKSSL